MRCIFVVLATGTAWKLHEDGPVAKVTKLLKDLQKTLEEDAKAEATSYDSFACFCKDTTKDKSESITTGSESVDQLTKVINENNIAVKEAIRLIDEANKVFDESSKELAETTASWETYKAEYTASTLDITTALAACKDALTKLKGSSFLQAKRIVQPIADMASAMNVKVALLQNPKGEYASHSNNIIEMIKKLETTFVAKKEELEKDHGRRSTAHDELVKSIEEKISASKTTKEENTKVKEEKEGDTADKTTELIQTQATLHDDQLYLKELTTKCESKAKVWDQRTKMRSDEIEAITQALGIIEGTVSEVASVNQRVFVQKKEQARSVAKETKVFSDPQTTMEAKVLGVRAANVARLGQNARRANYVLQAVDRKTLDAAFHDEMELVAARTPAPEAPKVTREPRTFDSPKLMPTKQSFIQVAKVQLFGGVRPADRAIAEIQTQAHYLHSPVLSNLLLQLKADPLAKVKTLIQQLINRLLEEAHAETTQKGWCDTEMAKSKTGRDFANEKALSAAAQVQKMESREQTLNEKLDDLNEKIPELQKNLKTQVDDRKKEKDANIKTIKDSQEGKRAVASALAILTKFYKNAALSFVSSPVDADAPDSGFSGSYKGAQGASSGILGLLDVIKSDFERTERMTTEEEAKSNQEFQELSRATKVDIASKETEVRQSEDDLKITRASLSDAVGALKEQQGLVDLHLEELSKLRPACVQNTMTYEERKARREAEIAALEKAITYLKPQ